MTSHVARRVLNLEIGKLYRIWWRDGMSSTPQIAVYSTKRNTAGLLTLFTLTEGINPGSLVLFLGKEDGYYHIGIDEQFVYVDSHYVEFFVLEGEGE